LGDVYVFFFKDFFESLDGLGGGRFVCVGWVVWDEIDHVEVFVHQEGEFSGVFFGIVFVLDQEVFEHDFAVCVFDVVVYGFEDFVEWIFDVAWH